MTVDREHLTRLFTAAHTTNTSKDRSAYDNYAAACMRAVPELLDVADEVERLRQVIDEVQEEMLPHDIGWAKLRAAIGLEPEL